MIATILVIDDSVNDRLSLCDLLQHHNYAALEAADAETGFDSALTAPVDLIIADVEMPGADGYSLCRRLRADSRTRDIPVLMLTCHGFAEERVAGLRSGADDYLVKPCDNDELVARIETLFRRFPPRARFYDRLEAADRSIEAVESFRAYVVVLNVDVVGSSKRPASNGDEYRRALALRKYRVLVDKAAEDNGGSEVAWAGDGGTAEFRTPADAVAAARAILIERASGDLRASLSVRIGIAAGWELLEPGAAIGTRTSQTHNRAGHFQKFSRVNTATVGAEIADALVERRPFQARPQVDGEEVFEITEP